MTGAIVGPGPRRLLVDGRDVAPLVLADTPRSRRTGLLGSTELRGALWITRCPSVHMVGMVYPIDVAVVDRRGRVVKTATLRAGIGATWPLPGRSATIEMPVGSLRAWGIAVGSELGHT